MSSLAAVLDAIDIVACIDVPGVTEGPPPSLVIVLEALFNL